MTPSELATMPGDKCILQLRGLPPFFSSKYDLKQHPNYKYTAEADKKKNAFDLDKLINRRRRPGLNEACEVYEVDASDTGPEMCIRDSGMGEDTPAPSSKVINLSDIQAADKGGKKASTPTLEKKAPEAV